MNKLETFYTKAMTHQWTLNGKPLFTFFQLQYSFWLTTSLINFARHYLCQ